MAKKPGDGRKDNWDDIRLRRIQDERKEEERLAKEKESADKSREQRAKTYERLESEVTKQKKEQAKLDDILVGNAKEKFAIDQKIAIVAAELKRLNELGEKASQTDILNVKKRLAELKESKKVVDSINNAQLESLEHADKEAVLLYDIKSNKKQVQKIDKHINDLKSGRLDLSKEETKKLLKQAEAQKGLLESNIELANVTQQNQKILDKGLGVLNLSVGALQGMVASAKAFTTAMAANPIMFALTIALAGALLLFGDIVGRAKDLQDNMGGSATQSVKMSNELKVTDKYLKMIGVNSGNVANAIGENFGTLSNVTADNVKNIGEMERTLGIASTDTAKFAKLFSSLTGETLNAGVNTAKMAASLPQSNDVAPGKVMADIASSTEEFAAYGKDGGKNIIDAAIAARKLGLELKTLTRISDTLLDFESSIQSEMEASMLIGKQLNYNKARELALQGDIAGAAKDVMKQIGGAAEFQKLNVVQRKKLAASIGVSVDEMSKLASGELKIKDDKTDLSKNTDQLMESIGAMGKLTIAIGVLTAAMAVKAGMDFFGGRGGRGSRLPRGAPQSGVRGSRLNPMNWGKTRNSGGNIRVNSKAGYLQRGFTAIKEMKNPLAGSGGRIMDSIRNIKNPLAGMKNPLSGGGAKAMDFAGDMFSMKNMKGLLSKGKFSIGGLAAGLLIDPIKNAFTEEGSVMNKMLSVADKTATYAGLGGMGGAAVGSVVPVAGNISAGAIGAIGGGLTGFGIGMWEEFGGELKNWWSGESKTVEAASKANQEVIKKVAQVVQTGPMQGPPVPPAELTEVQKAQAAIAEKQAIFEAEQKAIAAEEEKRLLEERARLEEERQATLAAEKAILEQQLQLQDLNSKLEQARANEANAAASIAKYSDPETKQVLSEKSQKQRMKMFERQLEQSQRNQDQLIAAIEKLNKTTANLADNS